jgi:hypothetical protein
MTVKDLLSMKPSEIALNLRADISKLTSFDVAARVKWLNERYQEGGSPKTIFDSNAMTFVISSWVFNWEGVNFVGDESGVPRYFDHGALTPIVAVMVPRGQKDGMNVYVTGSDGKCLDAFANGVV